MANHNVTFWYFSIICIFFIINIPSDTNADKEIPLTKISNGFSAPTLKFFYCYSCGYRKMFDEYANIINQKYPILVVDGANYDPPNMNMLIAKILAFSKMVLIILILSGTNPFDYLGQPQPSWWRWCAENKLYSCMMLFFLSNVFEGQLISSGAFEIFLNDVPVWSKLETGRIPQPTELFQIIDNHMRFADLGDTTVELKPGYAK